MTTIGQGAGVGFGQDKGLPSIIELASARSCHKYLSRHAWILCSLGLILIALETPAHSAEPRRCLRDGKLRLYFAVCLSGGHTLTHIY